LFYLRDLRGKAARIKSQMVGGAEDGASIASAEAASDDGSGENESTTSNTAVATNGKRGKSAKNIEAAAQA
jgi:hypothetical protein